MCSSDLENVIMMGEVIEDYPEDSRGHSCLISGVWKDLRSIHVVCAPKDEYLPIITTYRLDLIQWTPDLKERLA